MHSTSDPADPVSSAVSAQQVSAAGSPDHGGVPGPAVRQQPRADGYGAQAAQPEVPAAPGRDRTGASGLDKRLLLLVSGLVGVALIVTPLALLTLGVFGSSGSSGSEAERGGRPARTPAPTSRGTAPRPEATVTTDIGRTGAITGPGPANKCVDVDTNTHHGGNAVQLWNCNGGPGQRWTFRADHTIRAFGKCLNVVNNGTTSRTPVQLRNCNGASGEQWVQRSNGSLLNPHSNKCLDDPAAKIGNGTHLQIWKCNGLPTQRWKLL